VGEVVLVFQELLQRYQKEKADWEERYLGTPLHSQMQQLQLQIKRAQAKDRRKDLQQLSPSDQEDKR
jgi:hypothetical protein